MGFYFQQVLIPLKPITNVFYKILQSLRQPGVNRSISHNCLWGCGAIRPNIFVKDCGEGLTRKAPYSEFFCSVFSGIRTEYGQSEYGKIRTTKTPNTGTFRAMRGLMCFSKFSLVSSFVPKFLMGTLTDNISIKSKF